MPPFARLPRHTLATAATALFAVAALAPAAGAAMPMDPWGPAQPLRYGGTPLPGDPAVVLNRDGLGAAVSDIGAATSARGRSSRVSAFTNGVFLDPKSFGPSGTAFGPGSGGLGAYGHTGLFGAGIRPAGRGRQVVTAVGRLTPNVASLISVRPVSPAGQVAQAPAVAVNAHGDAAVVYAVCPTHGRGHATVYLTVRRRGVDRPRTVRLAGVRGPVPRVAAAINARGDALAAWTDGEDVDVRRRTAGGSLRPVRRAGFTRHAAPAALTAAISTLGAQLVGWSTPVAHGRGLTAGSVRVAQARTDGPFSSTTVACLPSRSVAPPAGPGVRVEVGPDGDRELAWTGTREGHPAVTVATVHGPAAHGPVTVTGRQAMSAPGVDTTLEDLDVMAGGAILVTQRAGTPSRVGRAVVQAVSRASASAPLMRYDLSAPDGTVTSAQAAVTPEREIVVWGTADRGARYAQRIGG